MEGKPGSTLFRRANKALNSLTLLRMTNYTYEKKARICRTLVFPKFFYGVEACDMPTNPLNKLRAASARVTNKGSRFQCNAIMFETASYGADLDPFVHILIRRVTALRRFLAKFPCALDIVQRSLQAYHAMGIAGSDGAELSLAGNDQAWRLPTRGPQGLLLRSLASFNFILTKDFHVRHALTLPSSGSLRGSLRGSPSADSSLTHAVERDSQCRLAVAASFMKPSIWTETFCMKR